jgi:hypothetical protein
MTNVEQPGNTTTTAQPVYFNNGQLAGFSSFTTTQISKAGETITSSNPQQPCMEFPQQFSHPLVQTVQTYKQVQQSQPQFQPFVTNRKMKKVLL